MNWNRVLAEAGGDMKCICGHSAHHLAISVVHGTCSVFPTTFLRFVLLRHCFLATEQVEDSLQHLLDQNVYLDLQNICDASVLVDDDGGVTSGVNFSVVTRTWNVGSVLQVTDAQG
jgi:hypothetical protein